MPLSFSPSSASSNAPFQIGSGIGRMILKEEMKARSGSYDNDPWGSARNSRSGSKETLNTTGYGTPAYNNTVNGCKDPPCAYASASLCLVCSPSFCSCATSVPSYSFFFLFYWPQCLLSLGFGARAVRLGMRRVRECHGCYRQGVLLRWKDGQIAAQLLLNPW